MTDRRNYEALGRLILAEFQLWSDSGYAAVDGRMAGRLATALAAQGVLVPSTLTDDEIEHVWYAGSDTQLRETEDGVDRLFCWPESMRETLTHLAKGES